jgi:phage terminase large subunit-like protein
MLASRSSNESLAVSLAKLPPEKRAKIIRDLTPEEAESLRYDWGFWARPKQIEPKGDWQYWLCLAGRGWGKTRVGAQWIQSQVDRGARRIALVAETAADARDVIVEGDSGILASAPPWNRPVYQPSKRRLTWPNGAVATTYSAEEPDQLRGPQHDAAWADELAKWRYPDAWDQLQFGLRLGQNPRCVVTTTPRPTPLIKSLIADPLTVVTRGSTKENYANLAAPFLKKILNKYQGTRLGRQELDAEILDDAPGALWKREQIEALRVAAMRPDGTPRRFLRVVVAIDPSVSGASETAETGIVAVGLGEDRHGYVLDDATVIQPTPEQWGRAAANLYRARHADRIIAEVNNGGDLVEANLRTVDRSLPVKQVRASRGKDVRAEPIAALYEQGRVHHVGTFPLLEDQMCQWEPGVSKWSPNRIDALVWALTELMIDSSGPLEMPKRQPAISGSRWDDSGGRGFG